MLKDLPEEVGYNQPHKKWKTGEVYLIDYGDGKTFKIGFTTLDPITRLKQIMKGNVIMPMQLVFTCYTDTSCRMLEEMLHMKFDMSHKGGEWFYLEFQDLLDVYRAMDTFGGVMVHDRWYELVPNEFVDKEERDVLYLSAPYLSKANKEKAMGDFYRGIDLLERSSDEQKTLY